MSQRSAGRAVDGRVDASMSLLVDLMADPLEPGYSRAAARRLKSADSLTSVAPRATARSRRGAFLIVLAAIGFTLAVSALALRPDRGSASSVKVDLVRRIEERRLAADSQVRRLDQLGSDIAARRSATLQGPELTALNAALAALEVTSGAVAVTGPGVVLTVDDSPTSTAADAEGRIGTTTVSEGAVLARDIQQLVNALWTAGAEAIDVNGQRMTSTAAITMAGRAIVVGYRPLTRPYVLTAIGPPGLLAGFNNGLGGDYLSALRTSYRIPSDITDRDAVRVAAGPALTARYARSSGSTPDVPTPKPNASPASQESATAPGPLTGGNP